jgi:DNA-binding transcriptional ArsR family regulator
MTTVDRPGPGTPAPVERPLATVQEAKAVAHPVRLRIIRLCGVEDLTNKQLADRLGRDPGTVLYHVRQLLAAGFLEAAPVRTGASGALEKPYRSTGRSWWIDSTPAGELPGGAMAPLEAFREELAETGPASISTMSRFVLHLSTEDLDALTGRIQDILDEYIGTDADRVDKPAHGGLFVMHRLSD